MTRRYLVVYEKTVDTFGGYAPDIPGCVSTGETLEEMRAMMAEAIEGHFECMAEDGDCIADAVTSIVDFSDETEANGIQYCIVEWLEVRMPAQAILAAQQPALASAIQDQSHHG